MLLPAAFQGAVLEVWWENCQATRDLGNQNHLLPLGIMAFPESRPTSLTLPTSTLSCRSLSPLEKT